MNTVHLLAQPEQKLQLDYKTSITYYHQKIELCGSPTIKELKKIHSSRWVGGADTQNRLSHTHVWWIKIRRDTSGVRDPSPTPYPQAQGSSARKISPHNFWL